jgi:hypothetical protein
MRRTVIGIHGLGNKAPKKVLRSWWKISIQEGFKHYGFPPRNFRFHMVYWAGLLHTEPLDARERDRSSGRYIPSPYHPIDAPINKKPSRFRKRFLDELERLLDAVVFTDKSFINFEIIADRIIQRLFSDLEVYYYKRCLDRNGNSRPAKEVIRDELAETLRKNRRRKILLIAHSMGSIIAYDVLCRADSGIRVDTFVTIGSPLGWPFIMKKHGKEHPGSGRARSLPRNSARGQHHLQHLPSQGQEGHPQFRGVSQDTGNVPDYSGLPGETQVRSAQRDFEAAHTIVPTASGLFMKPIFR